MKAFTFSSTLLQKQAANNYVVVHLQSDSGMKCFATESDADKYAEELNTKAKGLNLQARYETRPRLDGQAIDKEGNKVS